MLVKGAIYGEIELKITRRNRQKRNKPNKKARAKRVSIERLKEEEGSIAERVVPVTIRSL